MIEACALVAAITLVAHRLRPAPHRSARDELRRDIGSFARGRRVLAVLVGLPTVVARWRGRRRGAAPGDVAAWCDELGRRLRAGSTLRDALRRTSPPSEELRRATEALRHRLARGASLDESLAGVEPGRDRRHLTLAVAVIRAAGEHGGSTAQSLDRVAGALRLRAADEQERSAHSAQARLSAHVLTAVPIAFLVVVAAIDPSVRAIVASPVGVTLTAIGLLLNAAGWCWMRAIVGGPR